jgi:hypothetical protein
MSALSGEAMIEQALRSALSTGQAWLSDREKLKRLESLCLTDNSRRELDRMIGEWNQRIYIGLSPFQDRPYLISVAHYQLNSVESLKGKLLQFPSGTVFTWAVEPSNGDDPKAQELFRQLNSYLEEHGMKLERETKQ